MKKKMSGRRDEIYRYRSLRNGALRVSKREKVKRKLLIKGENIG